MAIAFRGANSTIAGTSSLTPTIHTSQVVGDMMILVAGGKPYDLGWSVSGWTSMGRGQSGTTASGVDVGSMALECWYKEAAADPETDPTITEGAPTWGIVAGYVLVFSKGAGETWATPTIVFGADETTGTDVSATMSADNSVDANDLVIALCVANTDAFGSFTTDVTATQTGVTFGTWTARNANGSVTGDQMAWDTSTAPVTAGPSSAAAVLTATGTATGGADRCELGYVRLRLGAPGGGATTRRMLLGVGT